MKTYNHIRQNMCPISRRAFFKTACSVYISTLSFPLLGQQLIERSSSKLKLRIIFALHDTIQPGPDWPNIGYDFRPVMDEIMRILVKTFPEWTFIKGEAANPKQAQEIVNQDINSGVDGFIVIQLNCWNQVVQSAVNSGKPVLYVDYKYAGSGGFLVYTASMLRSKVPNFAFISSSDPSDFIDAVSCFETIKGPSGIEGFSKTVERLRITRTPPPMHRKPLPDPLKIEDISKCLGLLKTTKIIAVQKEKHSPYEIPDLGIKVEYVPFEELNSLWKEVDTEKAQALANEWKQQAAQIVGVNDTTLLDSAKMYIAIDNLLKRYNAMAITIDCLGGFYGGNLPAYPCLSFFQLNNQGLVGACECDIRSTACMVLVNLLTNGRAGYISDPVLDSARREIVYAHCVAPNKVFGPTGPTNPFWIMSHSEDRKGASVRSIVPIGYLTTTLQIRPDAKELLIHQARVTANDMDDRACRTKICAEPLGDFEKLYHFWDQWGWHRVTAYGDLAEPLTEITKFLGWKLIQEA